MKKWKASLLAGLSIFSVGTLAGCSSYEGLNTDVEGEITFMGWSGSGQYFEDLGNLDLTAEDLTAGKDAQMYATAKAFNEIYPNVKINYYGKVGGPDDNEVVWAQELENFKAEYGEYPDVFLSTNLPGDIEKGMVADLSTFSEDPMYQSFNPALMDMMNYYGMQGGIPQYNLPWGVWVNESLAEDNNLDLPEHDWTIDEFTDFISQADMENFYGMLDTTLHIANTGTNSVRKAISEYSGDGKYVDLGSEEMKAMMDYIPEWAKYSVQPQFDLGNVPVEVMDENWWWSWKFFISNKTLVNFEDPWFMGEAAHPDPEHPNRIQATDWDIYPRPATDYTGNTVGVVVDPMAVYNSCMNDGDAVCSEEENAQIQLGYTFAAFYTGDTTAWQARADQSYSNQGVLTPALDDSFPLVTGEEFDKQMNIWYSTPGHQEFSDAAVKPGFHKVLELWEAGEIWDVSDKTTPWFYDQDGERRTILHEYENYWNKDIVGATRTDASWSDLVKSKLSDWSDLSNQRFAEAYDNLKIALKEFYGFTDEQFEEKE